MIKTFSHKSASYKLYWNTVNKRVRIGNSGNWIGNYSLKELEVNGWLLDKPLVLENK